MEYGVCTNQRAELDSQTVELHLCVPDRPGQMASFWVDKRVGYYLYIRRSKFNPFNDS